MKTANNDVRLQTHDTIVNIGAIQPYSLILRDMMELQEISGEQMANEMHYSPATISRRLNGGLPDDPIVEILRIKRVLNLTSKEEEMLRVAYRIQLTAKAYARSVEIPNDIELRDHLKFIKMELIELRDELKRLLDEWRLYQHRLDNPFENTE